MQSENRVVECCVFVIMGVFPFFILSHTIIVLLLFLTMLGWSFFKNKKGYSMLLISLLLILPSVRGEEAIMTDETHIINRINGVIMLLALVIWFLDIYINKKKINILRKYVVTVVSYFSMILFWAIINRDSIGSVFVQIMPILVYTIVLFNVFVNDDFICKKNSGAVVLIILFSVGYYYMDVLLHFSPYLKLYLLKDFEATGLNTYRPSGLFFISLLYSVFIVYALSWFLSNYKLNNILNIVAVVVIVLSALISGTRTTVVGVIIAIIFHFVLHKRYAVNFIHRLGYLLLLGIVGLFIIYVSNEFFNEYVGNVIYRFKEGSVGHREGGFAVAFDLFLDHPLGVGNTAVFDTIRKGDYTSSLFSFHFDTFDNVFLTKLSTYGILFFLPICYISIPYRFVYYNSLKGSSQRMDVIIYSLCFVALAFSFDIDHYSQLQSFMSLLLAVTLKSNEFKLVTNK